jgi:hypothetical protein
VKTVHFGLKISIEEYEMLTWVVTDENKRAAAAGFEGATTSATVRRLIKEEAQRRGYVLGKR